MVNGLADVVQEGASTSNHGIGAQFLGEHPGQVRHLHRVLQNILPVASTEVKTAKNQQNTWVKIKHPGFVSGLFTLLFNNIGDIFLRFFHQLFDLRRLDAAVGNQALQCHFGDVATNGVKGG